MKKTAFALVIVVLATLGVASPIASAPLEYRQFHLFLDATEGTFSSNGCHLAQFLREMNGTCEGTYATPTTTWPFNHGHGTVTWSCFWVDKPCSVSFFVTGAFISGLTPPDGGSLQVTGGVAPWATNITTGDEPGVAPGEKGGPLVMSYTDGTPGHSWGGYFDVHGWILVPSGASMAPPGEEEPTTTTVPELPPTTVPEPPADGEPEGVPPTTAPLAPAPATSGVATPRFTG
jgi:hypothetical protein